MTTPNKLFIKAGATVYYFRVAEIWFTDAPIGYTESWFLNHESLGGRYINFKIGTEISSIVYWYRV